MATSVLSISILGTMVLVQKQSNHLGMLVNESLGEEAAQDLLGVIKAEMRYARIFAPESELKGDLGNSQVSRAWLLDIEGFPDQGMLLVNRGTGFDERMFYDSFSPEESILYTSLRGEHCTQPSNHSAGAEVQWAPQAIVIDNQDSPDEGEYDGVTTIRGDEVFYRGDGYGIVYRLPTDTGLGFMDGDEILWGATVAGEERADGWLSLYYQPAGEVVESEVARDLNEDGDLEDTFNLGSLRRRSWRSSDEQERATDTAFCPAIILQERCAYGGDLDADGSDDPIFLWDPTSGQLQVHLFVLADLRSAGSAVREMRASIFLRNGGGPEED